VKFYVSFLYILVITSCSTPEKRENLKPQSVGKLAEIVVLSNFNDTTFKSLIYQIFQKPLDGYPPPGEKNFKTILTNPSFFKGYFKKHHNIFVIVTSDQLTDLEKVIDVSILNSIIKVHQSKPNIIGINQVDLFAKNQSLFFIVAQNRNKLMAKLLKNSDQLLSLAKNQEAITGENKLLGNRNISNDAFAIRSLNEKYYSIRKPKSYRIAIENNEFVWLRKVSSVKEQQFGIIMFESPYTDSTNLSLDSILKIRNYFTKKYIPGEVANSYMKYASAIKPVMKKSSFTGLYSADIHGWWDVYGDFMGGPYHLKIVVDENRNRIIYVEGFLFYPNESKAASMRELGILINTLKIK
tara:strand:- start:3239 stop:4297 length:1059 start_codon:yes stop_codon:yes gene_type:complete